MIRRRGFLASLIGGAVAAKVAPSVLADPDGVYRVYGIFGKRPKGPPYPQPYTERNPLSVEEGDIVNVSIPHPSVLIRRVGDYWEWV